MHVSGLFLYPVKSLRGIPVDSAAVDALGFVGDRRFMLIDDRGEMMTQRSHPQLARIGTALSDDALILSADNHDSLRVPQVAPTSSAPRSVTVSVWRSQNLTAEDCGDDAAHWLSKVTGVPCRLVRIGQHFRRPVLYKPAYVSPESLPTSALVNGRLVSHDPVTFADGYPFLVISEASLAALNDRLLERGEEPVPMDRFRPSIVVADCPPFAEDTWREFRLGELAFRTAGPCSRCIMTTTDQRTGERLGPEPLRTLATFRRDPHERTDVNFGQNVVHLTKSGRLSLGDRVAS